MGKDYRIHYLVSLLTLKGLIVNKPLWKAVLLSVNANFTPEEVTACLNDSSYIYPTEHL